ncbi:hypothetical protein PRUPE_3G272700 [Prunus persica]|uniref:Uncharacterized protein n=1 Tax=Prunus persica TaxID=3760 RepID=A0A251Q6B6_PRUPE|nr:hypothetical protein PRUPE_3G272700 [Prunus persica]
MCLDLEINILWILEYTAKRRDQDVERYISCDFLDLSKCKVVAVQRLHFPIPSTLHQAGKSALALDMSQSATWCNFQTSRKGKILRLIQGPGWEDSGCGASSGDHAVAPGIGRQQIN